MDASSHVQTLRLDSAVLDLEWTPLSHVERLGCMLCVATSTGSLEFFSFDSVQGKLEKSSSHQISSPDTLVLDLIWHPKKADVIAVTLSDGGVMLFHSQREDGGKAWSPESEISTTELATHSLEPWTLAFSHDCKKLFSGGDDAVLQAIRLDGEESTTTALWTDRRTHNAGVTAILPLPLIGEAELLITGSYDDSIRLLAAPDVGRRQILAELDLGGGVWRLKMLGESKEEKYVC
jgi:diphthamide biosynthesis protein 7